MTTYHPAKIVVAGRDTRITNLSALPSGTGCRYLEAFDNGDGTYIAARWRRKPPKRLDRYHVVLFFPTSATVPN